MPKLSTRLFLISFIGISSATIYLLFSSWGYDDVYITYRYADNIVQGNGFVYNVGTSTLSTTTPLFTLLLASLRVIGIEIRTAAILLSAISLPMGAICLWNLGQSWKSPLVAWFGLVLYPFFPLLLSTIGSEIPLFLLLCLSAFVFYVKDKLIQASIAAALSILCRPEAILVVLILILHRTIIVRRPIPLIPLTLFIVLLAPWFIFATLEFGSPIPSTLPAKLHQGELAITPDFLPNFVQSLEVSYLHRWQYWLGGLLALIGIFFSLKGAPQVWFLIGWVALHFISFTLLGLPGYFWYYSPIAPAFIMVLGYGAIALVHTLSKRFPNARVFVWSLGSILALAALISMAYHVYVLSTKPDPRLTFYKAIGSWVSTHTEQEASVGSLEVGIIGFYARRTMVDFAGIIQPEISEHLSATQSYEGAAIWGIKNYHPDYLILHSSLSSALGDNLVSSNCERQKTFDGTFHGYPDELTVYRCEW